MNRKMIHWNYKGLVCCINHVENGSIYSVYDIGAVTGERALILYQGKKVTFEKSDVEKAVDIYFKKHNIKPASTCKPYAKAIEQGFCSFEECCDERCSFTSIPVVDVEQDLIELEDRVNYLEDTLDEHDIEYEY